MKRQLPIWMRNNCTDKQVEIPDASKRITRSNSGAVTKKSDEPKLKLNLMPFIDYKGKIEYSSTMIDIACACDTIIHFIDNAEIEKFHKTIDAENHYLLNQKLTKFDSKIPIAFDMEWPFSFQTGPGRAATIQLCADKKLCYVFSIGGLKKLPAALIQLLNHQNIFFHGVNIKNDFRKLERDFPEIKSDFLIERCLDLGMMCNEVLNTSGRWSLERLVNYVCKLQINKSNKVRMSKWNNIPLDENQLLYAAIDVYIGHIIYRKLDKQQKEKTPDSIQQQILLKKLNLD